jgi:hypothetical protein
VGREAFCDARFGGKSSRGRALLESTEIVFRGDFRLRIPLREVMAVEAGRGKLKVTFPEGVATFALGPAAEGWALQIRSPRGLLDKLGVKPGARVSVLGLDEPGFSGRLEERTADVSEGRLRPGSDLVLVGMRHRSELKRLTSLKRAIKKTGAIWVVWPKGGKDFREDDLRRAGPGAGLVDVKVASFSETRSALKMVIPVDQR